jgi:MtN3 and saliva related transmembrane protein
MEALFTSLGFAAGFLTTMSFVPQALHSWRSGSAGDLSWLWLICFSSGVLLWFTYGLYFHSWPIILANFATFLLVIPIVVVKARQPRTRAKAIAE